MAEFEEKIDKIDRNSAYMRGQWDAVIPRVEKLLQIHDAKIQGLETQQANTSGKALMVGSFGGLVLSAVFTWLGKHF